VQESGPEMITVALAASLSIEKQRPLVIGKSAKIKKDKKPDSHVPKQSESLDISEIIAHWELDKDMR